MLDSVVVLRNGHVSSAKNGIPLGSQPISFVKLYTCTLPYASNRVLYSTHLTFAEKPFLVLKGDSPQLVGYTIVLIRYSYCDRRIVSTVNKQDSEEDASDSSLGIVPYSSFDFIGLCIPYTTVVSSTGRS